MKYLSQFRRVFFAVFANAKQKTKEQNAMKSRHCVALEWKTEQTSTMTILKPINITLYTQHTEWVQVTLHYTTPHHTFQFISHFNHFKLGFTIFISFFSPLLAHFGAVNGIERWNITTPLNMFRSFRHKVL